MASRRTSACCCNPTPPNPISWQFQTNFGIFGTSYFCYADNAGLTPYRDGSYVSIGPFFTPPTSLGGNDWLLADGAVSGIDNTVNTCIMTLGPGWTFISYQDFNGVPPPNDFLKDTVYLVAKWGQTDIAIKLNDPLPGGKWFGNMGFPNTWLYYTAEVGTNVNSFTSVGGNNNLSGQIRFTIISVLDGTEIDVTAPGAGSSTNVVNFDSENNNLGGVVPFAFDSVKLFGNKSSFYVKTYLSDGPADPGIQTAFFTIDPLTGNRFPVSPAHFGMQWDGSNQPPT